MKSAWQKMDKGMLLIMLILSIVGLISIYSSSSVSTILRYKVPTSYFFIRQLIILIVGWLLGIIIILRIPTKKYRYFALFSIIGVITLLILVFSMGYIAGGAQSWLDLGFFNLQPTEFAKSALIIYMAIYYDKMTKKKYFWTYYLVPIILAIIIFIFVAMQPDLGGAAIIAGIVFLIFLKIPFPKESKLDILKYLGFGLIIAGIVLLYSGSELFNSAQLSRLKFTNPCRRYMEDTGYQVCNGFIAYHNGGLFGVGIGNSSQKYLYLPEAHTDFIYPIIVEELGLIVGIVILLLFLVLLYRILKIAKKTDSVRNSIICYGTFIYLLLHLCINMMGSLALIPLTGVPLPFLSYGGSFNLNVLIMLFIVERIAIENKNNMEKRLLEKI